MSKICTQCREAKPLDGFHKHKLRKDWRDSHCKPCKAANELRYFRTKDGLLCKIHGNQRRNSKQRNRNPPEYNLAEFRKWALSRPEFHKLYETWKESGYQKTLVPSADRTDDYKPYSIHRLQWMTWAENNEKGCADRKNGINNKISKAVTQLTKDGLLVAEFHSARQAGRVTKINSKHINCCCLGKRKTTGGFCWEYTK